MEKVKLNNQIVLMRKYVKQAKVHSINRLTKQVKLLQNRKGDEIHVMKAKRKAERYLQEISLFKKVKPDDVSKLALLKAKNWKEVLLQKNSTLEDRCIAMLASYGPVQKEVELFHNSNKDIVSKISDFLKQWEEKSKFPKDKTQEKKSNLNTLQNTNILKRKMTGGLSNMKNPSEPAGNEDKELLNEEIDSSLLTENSLDLESEKKKKDFKKQNLGTSNKPAQNTLLDVNKGDKSDINECLEEKEMKVLDEIEHKSKKVLGNNSKNELENSIDSNIDNEMEMSGCKSSNENKIENESDMEKNGSENEDSELESSPENELKTGCTEDSDAKKLKKLINSENKDDHNTNKKSVDAENVTNTYLIPTKINSRESKPGENKLKAITVLNLDDFRDLDEIPVNNSFEDMESSDEENDINNDPSDKVPQNDPFFLSHDEAVSSENKLIDDQKSNNFVSVNEIFERKEKSNNHCNYAKNSHKPLNSSQFSSKYSSDYKGEKNFKTWKRDKSMQYHRQDRFQHKNKGCFDSKDPKYKYQPYKYKNFDRDNIKNKEEFNQKSSLQVYGHNQKYSKDLDHMNVDNFSRNSKEPHKKYDTNTKPLHPSWEAKRKQKEMNTSFQGKKIVFED